MLVIKRKPGESVVKGDDIEVTVVSVDKNSVRLAVQAPRALPVYRRELWDAIKKENLQALEASPDLEETLRELGSQIKPEDKEK